VADEDCGELGVEGRGVDGYDFDLSDRLGLDEVLVVVEVGEGDGGDDQARQEDREGGRGAEGRGTGHLSGIPQDVRFRLSAWWFDTQSS
jgi:hypothetical protein